MNRCLVKIYLYQCYQYTSTRYAVCIPLIKNPNPMSVIMYVKSKLTAVFKKLQIVEGACTHNSYKGENSVPPPAKLR